MQNIFLIGLSGSGKSSVGQLLAQRLGRPVFDIDALIEQECGERISTIFAERGEDYFRRCESRILAQVVEEHHEAIIATGGGIVTRAENRVLMASRGLQIYLETDPETALARMQQQQRMAQERGDVPEIRPLLAGPDALHRLQMLLQERASWYEDADIICSTTGKSTEQVVQEMIAALIGRRELASEAPPIIRRIEVGSGYDAVVEWGGLGKLGNYIQKLGVPQRLFLIADSNVARLYAKPVMQNLTEAGFTPLLYTVPAGEASKSQQQLWAIYDWLLEQHAERKEAIVALGGGVIGDLVGFAAATYLRGVPLIHVPTSLLAQVDSAIGGKTGINHPRGKNLIGAFYHPRLVLTDPATLLTLPARERIEGWAEIVKYGIILDAELFAQLEAHADLLREFSPPPAALVSQIVARCIDLKARVIEEDEREQGQRAILNYGHTIGHALENVLGYGQLLHGEAVSLGMVVAATLAQEAGMFAPEDAVRQNSLLQRLGLPIAYTEEIDVRAILEATQLDKKVASKRVRWIMPLHIGEVTITPMPDVLVQHVVETFFTEKRTEQC